MPAVHLEGGYVSCSQKFWKGSFPFSYIECSSPDKVLRQNRLRPINWNELKSLDNDIIHERSVRSKCLAESVKSLGLSFVVFSLIWVCQFNDALLK